MEKTAKPTAISALELIFIVIDDLYADGAWYSLNDE
jgi:hypothetical protein